MADILGIHARVMELGQVHPGVHFYPGMSSPTYMLGYVYMYMF
jgi:hypothetical protein